MIQFKQQRGDFLRDVGKNIKTARVRKKLTQDELAEKLYVTRQTVSNYETGKSRPDIEILVSLADILGTEVNELLYGCEKSSEKKREKRVFFTVFVILLVVWIALLIVMPYIKTVAATRYLASGMFLIRIFVVPAMCFTLGWLVISACGIFLGAKPLQFPMKKRVKTIASILLIIFLILLLPMFISLITLAIEEIRILLTDGPNTLSWKLGGDIPIISKISVQICLFIYRFPYVAMPFGVLPWLLKIPETKNEPQ